MAKTGYNKSELDAMYYQGFADGVKNVTDNIIQDIVFASESAQAEQRIGIEIALNIIKSHIPQNKNLGE